MVPEKENDYLPSGLVLSLKISESAMKMLVTLATALALGSGIGIVIANNQTVESATFPVVGPGSEMLPSPDRTVMPNSDEDSSLQKDSTTKTYGVVFI